MTDMSLAHTSTFTNVPGASEGPAAWSRDGPWPDTDRGAMPSADVLSDQLSQALIVIGAHGDVGWASRTAVAMIDASPRVHLRREPGGRTRLVCGSAGAAARLETALQRRGERHVGVMLDADQRMLLRLLPADGRFRIGRLLTPACGPDPGWLAEAFGLSAAEARALDALARFDRGADAAAHLGISQHTLKDHLAAIYAKTGCDRKAQLFRLLGLAHG